LYDLDGTLIDSGWMDRLAVLVAESVGGSAALAFLALVVIAILVSGFVDNVPFLLIMIPVVQAVTEQIGALLPLLMFGLLIGACLGGNLTPIDASANVVTLGILRKRGHTVKFRDFMRIGSP
jgi:Na+/H+ antiporter NhaD/arsenite permease-like protein